MDVKNAVGMMMPTYSLKVTIFYKIIYENKMNRKGYFRKVHLFEYLFPMLDTKRYYSVRYYIDKEILLCKG